MSSLATPPRRAVASPEPAGECRDPIRPPRLGRGAVVLALRVVSLSVSTATAVFLARWMGLEAFGRFEAALGWLALLSVLAGAGLDRFAVREIAVAEQRGDRDTVAGLLRATLMASLVAAFAVGGGCALLVGLGWTSAPTGLVLVALGMVPAMAVLKNRQAGLQGLSRIVPGHVPELVVVPLVLLASVAGIVAWARERPSVPDVLLCQLGALVAGALVAWVALARAGLRVHSRSGTVPSGWLRAAAPLVLVAGLHFLNSRVDVVMLDALGTDADVARYACANRLAALVALPLLAANGALAPVLARLAANGDRAGLQRALVRSARWSVLGALPVAMGLWAFGAHALGVFGAGFATATVELRGLLLAQFLNVAVGSVGLVLMMAGHVRSVTIALTLSGLLNLGLDAWLVPRLGSLGAAIATGTSLAVWNGLLALAVWRRLGVVPGVLGRLRAVGGST